MSTSSFGDRVTFRSAEASALGLTRHQLSALGSRRLTRGIYAMDADDLALRTRARAVLHACGPDLVFSHHTAGILLGGVVPPSSQIHVTTGIGKRIKRTGVTAHRTRRAIATIRRLGLPITDGPQTFLDLAAILDLVDLVTLGDSLVRAGVTGTDELMTRAAAWRGVGVALARRAAALVRAEVDSPRETKLRLLIVLAGLPEPAVQIRVPIPGQRPYRLDLGYEDVKLGIEYDGRHHAESETQWNHDLRRREHLDSVGWRTIVVNAPQLWNEPQDILTRIVRAGRDRGKALPDPRPDWRRYFPSARR